MSKKNFQHNEKCSQVMTKQLRTDHHSVLTGFDIKCLAVQAIILDYFCTHSGHCGAAFALQRTLVPAETECNVRTPAEDVNIHCSLPYIHQDTPMKITRSTATIELDTYKFTYHSFTSCCNENCTSLILWLNNLLVNGTSIEIIIAATLFMVLSS